jgi:hypothetical protein
MGKFDDKTSLNFKIEVDSSKGSENSETAKIIQDL